jgi:hypothetical protein
MKFFFKYSLIVATFLAISTSVKTTSKAESLNCDRQSSCVNLVNLSATSKEIDRFTEVEIIWQIDSNSFPSNWGIAPQNMQGNSLSVIEARRHLNIVKRALAKYPPDLIQNSFEKIYLVKNLEVYGSKFDGFYIGEAGAIYLNNLGLENQYDDLYLEGVLHHEISSFLLARYATTEFIAQWQQHNPEKFQYSKGDGIDYYQKALDRGLDTNEIREDCLQDGFLNIYARSNLENDFNEIAERIFTEPEYLRQLASNHPKLQYKLELFDRLYSSIDPEF